MALFSAFSETASGVISIYRSNEMNTATETLITGQTPDFGVRLRDECAGLKRLGLDTIQINLGRLCNQTCHHCHVEAGPGRKEVMSNETVISVVDLVRASGAGTIDLTGGAPEMNPSFRPFAEALTGLGKRVIVRTNLTALLEPELEDIPRFLAERHVEIVASMPCYLEENVDAQRGHGVYKKSIEALRRLNGLGYGREGSGLVLDLVYNPGGPSLPGPQADLEKAYKDELASRFGLVFNHLFTITNQPLGRFAAHLNQSGELTPYVAHLAESFNAANLPMLMCLRQISVSWDGLVYDCDFNQCLDLPLGDGKKPYKIGEIPPKELLSLLIGKDIRTGNHCYACTAGGGSSCGGVLS